MSEQDDSYLDLLEEELQDKCDTIEFLDAELVRLRAQLAAVPVEAIRRYWQRYNPTFGFLDEIRQHEADHAVVGAWLSSLEAKP